VVFPALFFPPEILGAVFNCLLPFDQTGDVGGLLPFLSFTFADETKWTPCYLVLH
jgi:hypothetical protein